jgi:hypothetical protein
MLAGIAMLTSSWLGTPQAASTWYTTPEVHRVDICRFATAAIIA